MAHPDVRRPLRTILRQFIPENVVLQNNHLYGRSTELEHEAGLIFRASLWITQMVEFITARSLSPLTYWTF